MPTKMAVSRGTGQIEKFRGSDVRDFIMSGLELFRNIGKGGQIAMLKTGFYDSLNEWLRCSIASKDLPLMKEILELLKITPTSKSELKTTAGRLSLTIEKLLVFFVNGVRVYNEEDTKSMAYLCAEVVARWAKIMKNNLEETDNTIVSFTNTDSGEVGMIVPIKSKPGQVYKILKGEVSEVTLVYEEPPPLAITWPDKTSTCSGDEVQSRSGSEGSEETGVPEEKDKTISSDSDVTASEEDGVVQVDKSKVKDKSNKAIDSPKKLVRKENRPRNVAKVFTTPKSRSDMLLEEMMTSPPSASPPVKIVDTRKRKEMENAEEKSQEMRKVESVKLFKLAQNVTENVSPEKIPGLEELTRDSPETEEIQNENVSKDLQKSDEHKIEEECSEEIHLVSVTIEEEILKEKSVEEAYRVVSAFDTVDSNDEPISEEKQLPSSLISTSDDDNDDDFLNDVTVIDYSNETINPVIAPVIPSHPWILRKIFPQPRRSVEVNSEAAKSRPLRELLATLAPSSPAPETPDEPDEDDKLEECDKKPVLIPADDLTEANVTLAHHRTEVYNHNSLSWPEPKEVLVSQSNEFVTIFRF